MRLNVIHETHYSYSSPVVLSQQIMHLAPRALDRQYCHEHHLSIEPEPGEFGEGADFFGNRTARILIAAPHDDLLVRAVSTVSVAPREEQALALPQTAWEEVRDRVREPGDGALA
ncbi:MAG TPA: transglutaminase N-terminal domain-containing protein, partial [Burkholderiales bacterium]